MLATTVITEIEIPFDGQENFVHDAEQEGYEFVDRMFSEWRNDVLRFNRVGERFLGATIAREIVGVGGISIDQYLDDPSVGRIKHIYVLHAFRKMGVARSLVENLLVGADQHFRAVRLRTNNPKAAKLYESLGFKAYRHATASHILQLS